MLGCPLATGTEGRAISDIPSLVAAPIETGLFGPLTVRCRPEQLDELRRLAAEAAVYATRAKGAGTLRAYRSAWGQYTAWCERMGIDPLSGDAGLIGLYAAAAADRGLAPATINVHLAAIATAHRLTSVPVDLKHPRIAMVMEGVIRSKGRAPAKQAAAIMPEDLRKMLMTLDGAPLGLRNRVLLLIGYGAALRRSELVALRIGDVTEVPGKGLAVLVRRSKTDQQAAGHLRGIWSSGDPVTDVVQAWRAWRDIRIAERASEANSRRRAVSAEEPLFVPLFKDGRIFFDWQDDAEDRTRRGTVKPLSDKAVDRLVKDCAAAAKLPKPEGYSGHSLRAGLATSAGEEEAELQHIMRQTGHKSVEVAMRYLRGRDIWRNNVTEKLFRTAQP